MTIVRDIFYDTITKFVRATSAYSDNIK